jgi:hypothetical protein
MRLLRVTAGKVTSGNHEVQTPPEPDEGGVSTRKPYKAGGNRHGNNGVRGVLEGGR